MTPVFSPVDVSGTSTMLSQPPVNGRMSKRKRGESLPQGAMPATNGQLLSGESTHQDLPPQLPSISRKITACTACRKQKIRCDMPDETPPCTRCSRKGISCVLNKSLQALLDEQRHVDVMRCDIRTLHETLEQVCRQLNMEKPPPLVSDTADDHAPGHGADAIHQGQSDVENDENACDLTPPASASGVQAPMDTFNDIAKHGSPASAGTPQSLRHKPRTRHLDLIEKRIITLPTAQRLVDGYVSRLDHYLYGIGGRFKDIQELRQSSPVLFAAICTVSALHDAEDHKLYEACNREYRRLVSSSMFEKGDLEYLRALCIGSFWLADASRILASDAVRRAADMGLRRNFYHIVRREGDAESTQMDAISREDARDRTQLWYILFVCDQHLSILHDRDGLLRNDQDILTNWELYLSSPGRTDSDVRILSQVSLLLIMSQVRDAFGAEQSERVPRSLAVQINHFSRQLDDWFAKFDQLFQPNPKIGDFPSKGLRMHYHLGKLYLGQHIFRGLKTDPIPMHFIAAANMACSAAVNIFDMILNDESLQQSLVGVPHYFHIMIAFAGHFLLEVCQKHSEQLMIDLDNTFQLIGAVLNIFAHLPAIAQHPICRMTLGLGRKTMDCASGLGKGAFLVGHLPLPPAENEPPRPPNGDHPVSMEPMGHLPTNRMYPYHMQQMPSVDDFSYPDFPEFQFPDMHSNFLS